MAEEIEAEALVEIVKAIDRTMTRDKLRRWHGAGLLCRPRLSGQGRGGGSLSYYPVDAIEPAKTIAVLLKERRDFGWVGWKLWLMDYPVAEHYWRPRLQSAAECWDQLSPIVRALLDADDERLAQFTTDLFNHRTDNPVFLAIRKAIGPKRFEAAIASILEIAAGYDVGPGHDPESEEYRQAADLIDLVLGLRRARTDHVEDGPTLLRNDPNFALGDYLPLLTELGQRLSSGSWTKFLVELSEEDLNIAKRELANILGYVAHLNAVFTAMLGPDAFGLSRISAFRELVSSGDHPLIIVGWAIWRQTPGVADGVRDIRSALENAGLPPIENMERMKIDTPIPSIQKIKLKRTRRVYPHQEWINSKIKS
jgi:hypothetical protein